MIGFCAALVASARPGVAFAQDPITGSEPARAGPPPVERPPEAPDPRRHGVVMDGGMGGGEQSTDQGAATGALFFTFTTLYYGPLIELGLNMSAGAGIFGPNATLLSGLGGIKLDAAPWLRFDILAEGGMHLYSGLGREFSGEALERRTETLPYLGGRGGVAFLLGGAHRFLLGAWFAAGHDLGERSGTVLVRSCFLGCSVNEEPYVVGGPSWSLTLRIGGVLAKF